MVKPNLKSFNIQVKKYLSNLSEINTFSDIVRNTKGGTEATNHDIDLAIQKWLKGASDRQGGRDKRRREKQCGGMNQHQQEALNEQNEGGA